MQIHQYEQIFIKCQYINTVCDTLLKEVDRESLSKLLRKSKLEINDERIKDSQKIFKGFSYQAQQQQGKFAQKERELLFEIKKQQKQIKQLKTTLHSLKQVKVKGVKNTRQVTKRIRETSQLDYQLTQMRKLLNCELQHLVSIENSSFEIRQSFSKSQTKEQQINKKLTDIGQRQKLYEHYRSLETEYDRLMVTKNKTFQQNLVFNDKYNSLILKKLKSIAQSTQNILQMESYVQQINNLIKEQTIIIDQIQSREQKQQNNQSAEIPNEDNDEVFQQQISKLRKTIANRKFNQRLINSNINQSHEQVQEPSQFKTPKSKPTSFSDAKRKPIFKIQIEPVSHMSQSIIQEKSFSKVMPLSKVSKTYNFQKNIAKKENQLDKEGFSKTQIEALKKILKSKEEEMKRVMHTESFNEQPVSARRRYSLPNKSVKQTYVKTEPILQKIKQEPEGLNSRFIEHIIEENSEEHLKRLKQNIRIRTKKFQAQRDNALNLYNLRRKQFKSHQKEKEYKTSYASSDPVSALPSKKNLQKTSQFDTQKQKSTSFSKNELKTQQNSRRTVDTASRNQFLSSAYQSLQSSSFKPKNFKYKQKVQTIKDNKNSTTKINSVLKRIRQLKNEVEKAQSPLRMHQQSDRQNSHNKIKIFKLCNTKKSHHSANAQRKGYSEGMEIEEEEVQHHWHQLTKIEEVDESIRNTNLQERHSSALLKENQFQEG